MTGCEPSAWACPGAAVKQDARAAPCPSCVSGKRSPPARGSGAVPEAKRLPAALHGVDHHGAKRSAAAGCSPGCRVRLIGHGKVGEHALGHPVPAGSARPGRCPARPLQTCSPSHRNPSRDMPVSSLRWTRSVPAQFPASALDPTPCGTGHGLGRCVWRSALSAIAPRRVAQNQDGHVACRCGAAPWPRRCWTPPDSPRPALPALRDT